MRVLALFLGVLLAAAFLEVVFQILPSRMVGYDVDHEEEKFIKVVEFAPDGLVNREVFHDVDHAPGPADATRVILLGDSYVGAKQVRLSQTVGQQLESALVSRSGRPFEVISIGHANWGQAIQYLALQNAGRLYHPDIVVTLFVGLNDVSDDSPEVLRRLKQNDAKMFRRRPGWIDLSFEDAPHLYVPRSALNRFISHRLAILESRDAGTMRDGTPIPYAYYVYRVDYDQAWKDAWAIKREWVRKTQTLAGDHAARYFMVSASTPQGVLGTAEGLEVLEAAYPAMKEFSWDLDKANRLLGRLCTELSIPLLHLEPIFRERLRETGEALHWQYDGHWTPEGNRLAGDLIAEFVLEQLVQTGR